MALMRVNGVDLYYEQHGRGDRIVMTHGAWSDGRAWEAVAVRLAARFEVVTWDRRGHSRSGGGVGPGSTGEDASDLAGLIEHLGSEPVHVVGNSAGGNVVLNLVTMRPDLVRSAAVHEPAYYALLAGSSDPHLIEILEHDSKMTDAVEGLIAEQRHREAAQYFVNFAIGSGTWEQFPEDLRQVMESNATTVIDDLRDGGDIGSVDLESLTMSSVPLLISTGTDSPELEVAAARELARRVGSARLQEVEGFGHIPHRTHPDSYAALLVSSIDSLPRTGRITQERSQR